MGWRSRWRIYFGAHDAIELVLTAVLLLWMAAAILGCLYGLLDLVGVV